MIYLDDRIGSRDLLPYIRLHGIEVEEIRLDAGDACWSGEGPDGEPVMIGMERKRISDGRHFSDMLTSMRERRLSGSQLEKLHKEFQFVYLIVEGVFRPGQSGQLETLTGRYWQPTKPAMLYSELSAFLDSMNLRGGMIVERSNNAYETACILATRYKSWQKPWRLHKAHKQVYAPVPNARGHRGNLVRMPDGEKDLCRAFAAQLPGVDSKCWEVADYFGNARTMVNAAVKDWIRVKGIGKKTAAEIDKMLGEQR